MDTILQHLPYTNEYLRTRMIYTQKSKRSNTFPNNAIRWKDSKENENKTKHNKIICINYLWTVWENRESKMMRDCFTGSDFQLLSSIKVKTHLHSPKLAERSAVQTALNIATNFRILSKMFQIVHGKKWGDISLLLGTQKSFTAFPFSACLVIICEHYKQSTWSVLKS